MVQLTRHHHLFDFDQSRQGNHGFIAATHENLFNVIGGVTPTGGGLHHHFVLLTFALVTGDVAPTHHGLDRAGNGVHGHAHVGGTFAVHLHADLRLVQTQVSVNADNAWIFSDFVLELADHL